jgi:poly(ADP-ribose) glycohydrolase ARH3
MIGLAESLVECRGFSGAHMSKQFIENFDTERGYGPGTIRVLNNIKDGQRWNEAAAHLYGGGSYGNGAAMRIAPVGAMYFDRPEMLKKVAEVTSRITHTHPLGVEGAMLQAYAVGMAVEIDPLHIAEFNSGEFLDRLSESASSEEYRNRLKNIKGYLKGTKSPVQKNVIDELGVGVQAHKSVPMALYCFLKEFQSFRDAVTCAVNMGGDTDTIGAMTGALAGALHGIDGIPEEWIDELENTGKGKDYIIELGEKLYRVYSEL